MIVYHETYFLPWSDTTLKYWTMLVQRYPNLNEKVGGSFPGCEISCPLDINLPDGQLPLVLWHCYSPFDCLKRKEKKRLTLSSMVSFCTRHMPNESQSQSTFAANPSKRHPKI